MPRHDPDVIAALAEGRLDPEEAERLEREIAADPVAAAELADHRAALAFIADAPRVELTASERSDLHTAIAAAIGMETSAATTDTTPAAPRRVAWGSIGIAAAALAGLVAVVPVVGLLSTGGSGDDASTELASEAPTTVASADLAESQATADDAGEARIGSVDEEDGLSLGADATPEAATFGSSTTRATTTTVAPAAASEPAPTTTAPAEETTTTAAAESTTTEPAGPEGLDDLSVELETLRSDPAAVAALAPVPAEEGRTCWVEDNAVRADPPPERLVFEYQSGELTVIVYYEEMSDGTVGPFQVWGLPDCADLVVVGE